MGGFPALRCGILLKAETAISAGGQFPWYPHYVRKQELNIPAFDLLCDCTVNTATTLICCYSSDYKIDAECVDILARVVPVQRIPIVSSRHGFFDTLWQEGRLRAFFDRLFGTESDWSAGGATR